MIDIFSKNGVEISSVQEEQFNTYYDLLISWNKKMNLTSITSYDEVLMKHFLDSALLFSGLDNSDFDAFISDGKKRVLDVGTGAGFPGLVLAILRPDWEFVLLDSLNKRVDFLYHVIDELSLANVSAIHSRAEDLARDDNYRCGFDLVVSRAVADLRLLLELCIPFVSDDGYFVSYKGPKYESELKLSEHAQDELGVNHLFDKSFCLSDADRTLVVFNRVCELSDKYPRRAGIPAKRPL